MKTNIYHITHTPTTGSVSLRFWGCNMSCHGCLCKEGIYDHLLKENRFDKLPQAKNTSKPGRLLELDEVLARLDELQPKKIFLTGEEASLDPNYAAITKAFHQRFNCENVLYTNGFKIPEIEDTDAVEVGIKAISEELHQWYTERSVEPIKQNFIRYAHSEVKLTAASILIPGLVEIEEIERIAQFIASVNPDIPYFVLPYFPAGDNNWRKTRPEEVAEAVERVSRYLTNVSGCRGVEQEILYEVERVV
ncbi:MULTISPECIES: radical SAM protein [Dehalococcoides]|uniref:Radical SAM domain protein n=2 Tax=Dehalococcoides mccartyi TaxID=61435 RepID=A0A142V8G8_9CHLR|nr:radical SAM protein [Dehalococcoides mccartyi]AGG05875.1 radical SAM domain-containing protein [Dehalococcoides mccartyi DCMB5]AMU86068.1 radical SAM domain-containing protein [Dehalococcoides mccartyi]MBA2084635.1 Radical SAM domain protein [Dehalococcoides mccartyi]OBW62913.1 MAG: radical SAM protein [Dehalococcoides mccartyi]PKH48341.1 radical SAM protein [Dehalococcoides mccartyi]